MELYILRHGIAVDRATPGFEDDSTRPLTAEGQKKMRQNAQGMKIMDLSFDVILSSPYLRAKETATIVLQKFKTKNNKMLLTKALLPEASIEQIIKEINLNYYKNKSLLLVGHEPHLSSLISVLLTGKPNMIIDFKKGGLCRLTAMTPLSKESARLDWLLTPSQLRKLC